MPFFLLLRLLFCSYSLSSRTFSLHYTLDHTFGNLELIIVCELVLPEISDQAIAKKILNDFFPRVLEIRVRTPVLGLFFIYCLVKFDVST